MRKLSLTIFFFLLIGLPLFALTGQAFSADEPQVTDKTAPPKPGAAEEEDELGLGEKLPEEKEKKRIVKPEDLPPFKMVYVKGGCFEMGDWEGEGDDDEVPVHEVCVSDYYMQETEVTQGLFEAVMGFVPSMLYDREMPRDPKDPVTYISWHVVNEFIRELNKITGGFYRLPTEAEWEYAARSGGKKDKWPGVNNEAEIADYALFEDNSDFKLNNVKLKKPNAFGIYDMAGNVWEWTEDNFDFEYYQVSAKEDPYGPDFSFYRSVRGGSLADPPNKLRTTYRYALEPSRRYMHVGFRLAE